MHSTDVGVPAFRVYLDDAALKAVVNATIAQLMAEGLIGAGMPPVADVQSTKPQRAIRRVTKPDAPLNLDAIYAAREAAPYLGMDYRTLQRIHAEGNGPPRIALSRRRFGYRGSDLRDWLISRRLANGASALPATSR
jgi:hypothetical protein